MKRFLFALVATLVLTGAMASVANAQITLPDGSSCIYATDRPAFKGWAQIDARACPYGAQTADYKTVPAWHWSNGGWSRMNIGENTRVYVYPFGSGWSWVWTKAMGWMAVQSKYVMVDQSYAIGDCTVGC